MSQIIANKIEFPAAEILCYYTSIKEGNGCKAKKKVVLFPEISRVKMFYHSPARIVECVSVYIFSISKNKQESKEEKRICRQNRLKK